MSCVQIPDTEIEKYDGSQLVLVAQMPHVRDEVQLEYSPWFQSILGLLLVEFKYDSRVTPMGMVHMGNTYCL